MPNFTKKAIKDSMKKLLNERPLNQITVKDIVEDCGINRNSFYYHFEDMPSLIEEIVIEEVDNIINEYPEIDSLEKCIDVAFEFAMKNKRAAMHIYNSANRSIFEHYLMDEFCNKIMRLMLIEQFNNEEVKKVYDHWMFVEPLKFQSSIFQMLMEMGIIVKADSEYMAIKYYAPIFFFAQKWLFCGKLSEENKESFRKDAYKHIQLFFSEMEGA